MKDIFAITKYQIIDSEVKNKHKFYIILNECQENEIETIINQNYQPQLQNYLGIYLEYQNKYIQKFKYSKYSLHHQYTIVNMIKKIKTIDFDNDIKLEKITFQQIQQFNDYINELMFNVPGSVTYTYQETHRLIDSGFNELYFIKHHQQIVGIIELCLEEDIPEIMSIGILKNYQHQGFAKKALQTLEQHLSKEYQEICISVALENMTAYHLYSSLDYKVISTKMNYYLIDKNDKQ